MLPLQPPPALLLLLQLLLACVRADNTVPSSEAPQLDTATAVAGPVVP
jgi:hypothetical protein